MVGTRHRSWVRLYRESLHDPRVVSLTDRQFRAWHNILLIANDDGILPITQIIAMHLKCSESDAERLVAELVEARLVNPIEGTGAFRRFRLHDWPRWDSRFTVPLGTRARRVVRA